MSEYLVVHFIHHPQGVLKAASWRKLPTALFWFWQPDICSRTHRTWFLLALRFVSQWHPYLRGRNSKKISVSLKFFPTPFSSLKPLPQNRRREQIGFTGTAGWSGSGEAPVCFLPTAAKMKQVLFQLSAAAWRRQYMPSAPEDALETIVSE